VPVRAFLLDTGPIVASLDRHDSHHEWVMRRFGPLQGRMITTGAVITEAAFLLQDVKGGIRHLADFFETLRVEIWDCFQIEGLRSAEKLMATYADTPMDFADATLVAAAEHYACGDIATLDERGFCAFRYGRNKPFRMLLQGASH
jgi:predicted nucleic acid-binding protein